MPDERECWTLLIGPGGTGVLPGEHDGYEGIRRVVVVEAPRGVEPTIVIHDEARAEAAEAELESYRGQARAMHDRIGELERERDKAREDLARMMPDETSVLIPVSALNVVGERAEKAEAELRKIKDEASRVVAGACLQSWSDDIREAKRLREALSNFLAACEGIAPFNGPEANNRFYAERDLAIAALSPR